MSPKPNRHTPSADNRSSVSGRRSFFSGSRLFFLLTIILIIVVAGGYFLLAKPQSITINGSVSGDPVNSNGNSGNSNGNNSDSGNGGNGTTGSNTAGSTDGTNGTDTTAMNIPSDWYTDPSNWILAGGTSEADKALYNEKMISIANNPVIKKSEEVTSTVQVGTTTVVVAKTITTTSTKETGWPAANGVYPDYGALLPFNRIVAYYGNFYSTGMGVLGEYPEDEVLAKLSSTVAMWQAADPGTPVIPAIHYIVVTAQGSAGKDGKYRARMPDSQIEKAISMADRINGVVFLDFQVGLSNVQTEVPLYEDFLKLPRVFLALDPEFDMTTSGMKPGSVIGTMDASDINWAAQYLAGLVDKYNLPPKILVVHRFTYDMVTNTSEIKPLPQVQIVMDMDGFGYPAKKVNTYERVIVPYPVEFTGFKLFYKNDIEGPYGALMTPEEVLNLSPEPSYIQYQ